MKYTANKVLHRDRTITSHCVKSDRKPIGVKGRREMNERRKKKILPTTGLEKEISFWSVALCS